MLKTIIYFLVFGVGFIGVSLWSFWIVTHPPKIILDRTPADFDLPYEHITIAADDGTALAAWLIEPPESTNKAIILLHGYPAEKADMLFIARDLYPDFALLLMDMRYFGQSDGAYTTLGVKEPRDVRKAIDVLASRDYEQIGVFGFSLGGAVALITAASDDRIDAAGSYASFADIRQLGYETYRHLLFLKYPLVELMNLWSKLFFGAFASSVSPENAAQALSIPTFIVHTKEDEQISFSHALRLQSALEHNDRAQFSFPDRGLHGELPNNFSTRLKAFFKQSL